MSSWMRALTGVLLLALVAQHNPKDAVPLTLAEKAVYRFPFTLGASP